MATFTVHAATAVAAPDVDKVEQSIVRVVIGGHGTGWVVSPGIVATNWHVAEGNTSYDIYPAGTTDGYRGTLRWIGNSELDLALIDVPGLPLEPFAIHKEETPRGSNVYTVGFPGLGDDFAGRANLNVSVYGGTLSLTVENASGVRIIQHDNIVNAGNSGGPLLDECGRVLGLTTWGTENTNMQADFIWWSMAVVELADVMDQQNIPYINDSAPCVTGGAGNTTIVNGIGEDDVAAIVQQNNDTLNANLRAVAEANAARMEALTEKLVTWGGLGGIVLALTLALALRKPRQQIIHALEQISRKVKRSPDVELAGRGRSSGARQGLVISASTPTPVRIVLEKQVLDNGNKGLSLGRDAAVVDYSFADQGLSRRHARFVWKAGKVQVEDLSSTNGTIVNGRQLDPYVSTVLN
ncbi:MAG TPA: trypsin-like peptidase domain-containing protein, partial [Vicinamibacterales bacterium]